VRKCPYCQQSPQLRFASNTSRTRNANHYIFAACCARGETFPRNLRIVPQEESHAVETAWDEFAETLFAEYSVRWTEPQRVAYRARIWPTITLPVAGYEAPQTDTKREPRPKRETKPKPEPVPAKHFSEPDDCPWLEQV
jgi:hypothetical protein